MANRDNRCLLTERDLGSEHGLRAREIHERLVVLSRAHHRVESALCFYLLEVDVRQLYEEYGHASTVDYARECLGFEDWKTRGFLRLARRLDPLPKMKEAFSKGEIPYTKAREVTKVATAETEEAWIEKCKTLSNRQIEAAVRENLPSKQSRTLVLVLDEERMETWERTRDALEKLAGRTLTELEAFDLACAEALCTYDLTPASGDPDKPIEGYVAKVIERDEYRCTRPGCGSRSALTGNHIKPRSQGGSDEDWNLHTVCAVCHSAITRGVLEVSGRAPGELTWTGPFGVIERPMPKVSEAGEEGSTAAVVYELSIAEPSLIRESQSSYGPRNVYHVVHDDRIRGQSLPGPIPAARCLPELRYGAEASHGRPP